MKCGICGHEENRVVRTRRVEEGIARLRECLNCRAVWGTLERLEFHCERCGAPDSWMVTDSRNYRDDQKLRIRNCRICGHKIHTLERKLNGHILLEREND